ncbi:DUF485 domain-containing protein [Yinghuangia sp. YIM S09857]|uniref:DUF485 domain-containing protein n=1 Tax=Yinghuangia sp. YIM S09857 TaxID=3436929 RepID=UPI003F5395F7
MTPPTTTVGTTGTAPGTAPTGRTLHDDPRFRELRRRFRRFAFPVTAAFLGWYLLYVLLCAYARDFMAREISGNINVALVFGLGQFAATFLTAWIYSRFADRRLDPLSAELRAAAERGEVAS